MGKTIRVLRATPGLACGSEDPPEHTRQGGRFLRLCRSPKPATQRFFGQLELLLAMGFITCIDICFVYMYADTHACTVHVYLYMYVYIYIYIYIYLSLSLCVFYVFKFITQGYMWPPVVLHLHTKGCNRSKTHDHVLGGRGSIYQALLPKPCKP